MYKEIESSKLYIKSINDYINFHIDEFGEYWRDYDKICDVLLIPERTKNKWFSKFESEGMATVFSDLNNIRHEYKTIKFITTEAYNIMINREYEKARGILKEFIVHETKESDDFSEFKYELDELKRSFNSDDMIDSICAIRDISNSNAYKEALSKYDKTYDLEKEKIVDEFREDMYHEDVEEVQWMVLRKKKDTPASEEIKKKYEKNKGKSSCPSWIKDLVK